MRSRKLLSPLLLLSALVPATAQVSKEPPDGQKAILPETDPLSPRRSALRDPARQDQVIRLDVDHDGDPDVLECWWNGKRARWFDENDDMRPTDLRGDTVDDSVQIDRDGDGYYDGPSDMDVKWVDNDGDGDPDLEMVAMNPSRTQKTAYAGDSHWMVFEDIDDDNVNAYIDWKTFDFANWRFTGKGDFSPDYNGDSVFLKEHRPPALISDPRFNWENPFAFYDTDGDGCTEMAIRLCDNAIKNPGDESTGWHFDGQLEENFVTWDLDNDTGKGNEFDYDMTMKFAPAKDGPKIDYSRFVHKYNGMKAPAWVLPFYRFTNWRTIDELIYVPHDKAYDVLFSAPYGNAFLTFDEDDDDHRWERVELYYPGDPYSTARWDKDRKGGLDGHPQSDTLGDRGEWDMDFSGKGRVYIGRWDGKIHLAGAENGAWTVDYGAKYWGSSPVTGDSSPEKAPKIGEVVQYRDTDNNGFFDEITYDYDGDRVVDLKVNLLDYADAKNPHPDVAPLLWPGKEHWQGMHDLFTRISNGAWDDALKIYRAAWKKDLTTPEIDDLAIAASVAERYDHAYWLKEKVFRILDAKLASDPATQKTLRRAYFLGDIPGVVEVINGKGWE